LLLVANENIEMLIRQDDAVREMVKERMIDRFILAQLLNLLATLIPASNLIFPCTPVFHAGPPPQK
jgi:hypothetical protein